VPSFAILLSAVLVLPCEQTDRQTDIITEADNRYTYATTIGVSNQDFQSIIWRTTNGGSSGIV